MNRNGIKGLFKRRSVWAVFYAVYLALILLSVNAFYAEVAVDTVRDGMDESYTYHLTFTHDGVTTHYNVERHDTGKVGKIDLTYTTSSNKLFVSNVENIKTLVIDVDSLFSDEAAKVFKYNPTEISGMDMDYWLTANGGIFTVQFNIDESEPLESLTFTKFPPPESVTVNNQEWWTTDINYTVNGNSITIDGIPAGEDTTVVINWNKAANKLPVPDFTMDPAKDVDVDADVSFDASGSSDPDPDDKISAWLWNFGDGKDGSGETSTHAYAAPGVYTVRLTVRDDAEPYGEAWIEKTINVRYGAGQDTDGDGLPDFWEWDFFGDLNQTKNGDADSDTYPNGLEYLADTDPNDGASYAADYDSDTLGDKWEWQYFGDLDETATGDPDSDGADNAKEQEANTDPTDASSKPSEPEEEDDDDEDEGLLGMGKMGPLDTFIVIILIVVILILVVLMAVMRSRASKKRADEEAQMREAEAARAAQRQMPVRGPPRGAPGMAAAAAAPAPAPAPMPAPAPEPDYMPAPEPELEAMPEPSEAPELPAYEEPAAEAPVEEAPVEMGRDETLARFATELDIGLFEAGVLYDSGYSSFEALDGVLADELAIIDEIGPETAERIVNNLAFVSGAAAAGAAAEETYEEEAPVEEEAPAEEEAPVEEEAAAEEDAGAVECPVCGEPVQPGTTNCPVCDSPL